MPFVPAFTLALALGQAYPPPPPPPAACCVAGTPEAAVHLRAGFFPLPLVDFGLRLGVVARQLRGRVHFYDRGRMVMVDDGADCCAPAPLPPPPPPPTMIFVQPPPPAPPPPPAGPAPARAWKARDRVALVWLPFGATAIGAENRPTVGARQGTVALEARGFSGGTRLKLDYEYMGFGKIVDAGFKYDFNDTYGHLKPFLSVTGGVSFIDPENKPRFTVAGAAGLDFFITQDTFVSAQVQARRFTDRQDSAALPAGVTQVAALVGAGMYF